MSVGRTEFCSGPVDGGEDPWRRGVRSDKFSPAQVSGITLHKRNYPRKRRKGGPGVESKET